MSKVNLKKYDITQCALYKCQNKRRLEHLLNMKKGDLKGIINVISYHSFEIDKKNTDKKRKITSPNYKLKKMQSRILALIKKVNRPEFLISGEKGKCYLDNGKAHVFANYILTMDIRQFYDNCKREYVFRFFKDCLKTSGDIAGILSNIVTYNKGIPTGCPTSQLIAYYAYINMFEEINNTVLSYNCKFTLYVDDMTFSSTILFKYSKLANEVDIILRKYGHKPKYGKTKFYSSKSHKLITGVIVTPDHHLDIPNNLQKKIYNNFESIKPLNKSAFSTYTYHKKLASLKGQLQAAKNINHSKFPEVNRLVKKWLS